MYTQRKDRIICAGFLIMMLAAFSAWAQPTSQDSQERPMRGHGNRMEKIIQELNLTPQQQEQIKQLKDQGVTQGKSVREGLQNKRQELKGELDKKDTDEVKVKSIADELKQLEAQMIDLRIKRVLELKKVLTPEQYQVLQEKMKNTFQKGKHGRFNRDRG